MQASKRDARVNLMSGGIELQVLMSIATTLFVDETMTRRETTFEEATELPTGGPMIEYVGLGANSLDSVALVMAIEDHFSIELPDEWMQELRTVRQVSSMYSLPWRCASRRQREDPRA